MINSVGVVEMCGCVSGNQIEFHIWPIKLWLLGLKYWGSIWGQCYAHKMNHVLDMCYITLIPNMWDLRTLYIITCTDIVFIIINDKGNWVTQNRCLCSEIDNIEHIEWNFVIRWQILVVHYLMFLDVDQNLKKISTSIIVQSPFFPPQSYHKSPSHLT